VISLRPSALGSEATGTRILGMEPDSLLDREG
jgi:hypothetical protein